MQLKYVDTKEEIIAINRKSKHIEPHLHNALEIVCVTSGSLELGVGQELLWSSFFVTFVAKKFIGLLLG